MFPRRFFPGRFFPGRFFPESAGGAPPAADVTVHTLTGAFAPPARTGTWEVPVD